MSSVVSRRANLRINADAYADVAAVCSVTIGVKARAPVFAGPELACVVVDVLQVHAVRTGVSLWADCLMPDHVHLVLSPSTSCDIVKFVGQFKSLALRAAWKLGVEGNFWQERFWDHFVRRGDDADRVVRYVLDNPVRGGIVSAWDEFRFSGASQLSSPEKCGGQAPALHPETQQA